MVPIPQYPLYSASIALYGGQLVPYYLDEEGGWALDLANMRSSLREARARGTCVRALVFINPGNPSGACLTAANVQELIEFCYENKLVLIADEVYQENIYNPNLPFIGARRVLHSMPEPVRSSVELVSLHTVSKGGWGECGLRGGYMEVSACVCAFFVCLCVPYVLYVTILLTIPCPCPRRACKATQLRPIGGR